MSLLNDTLKQLDKDQKHPFTIDNTVSVTEISDRSRLLKATVWVLLVTTGGVLGWLSYQYYLKTQLTVLPEVVAKENSAQANTDATPNLAKADVEEPKQVQAKATSTSPRLINQAQTPANTKLLAEEKLSDTPAKFEAQSAEPTPVAAQKTQLAQPRAEETKQAVAKQVEKPVAPVPQKNTPKHAQLVKKVTRMTDAERAQKWYLEGQQAYKFGLTNDAILHLDKALTLNPGHIDARSLLAATYYGKQDYDFAESLLRHGLSLKPEVMRWRILLAKLLIEQKRYYAVLNVLPETELDKANIDFLVLRGTAAARIEDYKNAQLSFSRLTKLQPEKASWWIGLGQATMALAQGERSQLIKARQYLYTGIELGGLSPQTVAQAQGMIREIGGSL